MEFINVLMLQKCVCGGDHKFACCILFLKGKMPNGRPYVPLTQLDREGTMSFNLTFYV